MGSKFEVALHLLHCTAMYSWIAIVIYLCVFAFAAPAAVNPIERYGWPVTILIYIWKCLPLLIVHTYLFQLVGFTFYNSFKQKVPLKIVPPNAPLVCFRVVTRGNYPKLVMENLILNIDTCNRAGMIHFKFEIVTDTVIDLSANPLVREIVVPYAYTSKTGALFKARALQYCLEDGVNALQDSDWIVHLDEETLLSENSVRGIIHFVSEGKHDFGQGLITYGSGKIVNWITTLADTHRVADDCGKLRAQLSMLHKPIFGWKGSYVVTRYGAERAITWDHGPDGSICEDAYFAILAIQAGHSFGFVEGEMHEQSPFSTLDLLRQRKRWLEGLLLVVHSSKIGILYKLPLAFVIYSWLLSPLTIVQFALMPLLNMPKNIGLDSIMAAILALNIYMFVFGAIRSFAYTKRSHMLKVIFCCIGACLTVPYTAVIQAFSVILFIFGRKKQFYVVKKELGPTKKKSAKVSPLQPEDGVSPPTGK
ncbi:hypothetical protein PRIPAC_83408 [Pristionchus pacificus]|uniref:Glyco_trans_2-like domain-containing protein n=1 Tax=Pristionchus pacificus TaxID=54126 RepID=A0A2A6BUQ4_PRIPA|nr:hypothetical protein PRIPAC_83408 [Pristionchus pacificus]|eukprot:PDM69491.1 hypothetical protein PRIPAC_44587 [Pristionchus pacificus]